MFFLVTWPHGYEPIGFTTDRNKIRLKINLEAARGVHLTISSKLLRVAETG